MRTEGGVSFCTFDVCPASRLPYQVDLKLQGINQMRSPTPHTVDGQVARLINDATDINNLGQMYVWWMPWC